MPWTELFSLTPILKPLIPHVLVFGDKAFKEMIKAKLGHKGGALIKCAGGGHGRRRGSALTGKGPKLTQCCPLQPREASGEANPVSTLTLDSQLPEL